MVSRADKQPENVPTEDALASAEDVAEPGVVEVVETVLRPSQLARADATTSPGEVRTDVVYGICSMCTNMAPHINSAEVLCPRCGSQPVALPA